jgi:hypothetical protein
VSSASGGTAIINTMAAKRAIIIRPPSAGQDVGDLFGADIADVLIPDHALAIDDEGFGHAARPDGQLHRRNIIRADPRIGIAILAEEGGRSSL